MGHCFCFDLARVFIQGATMPLLQQIFWMSLMWEWGIVLLLRVSHGISSRCEHATPYTPFFGIVIVGVIGALCFCFDLAKVFCHGTTMPHLHHFFGIAFILGRALCFCFDFSNVFLQGANMPPLHHFL